MLFQRAARAAVPATSTWPGDPAGSQSQAAATPAPAQEGLGHRARRLFDNHLRNREREPEWRWLHRPGLWQLLEIGRWLYWWGLTAGGIKREPGISRGRQLREAWRFTWQERIQAQLYYMFELYRPAEQRRAGAYLTRRETKNGLMRALNFLARQGKGRQTDFGDKTAFIELLRRHGLPTTAVLFSSNRRGTDLTLSPAAAFDCDLFVKDRYGKGAQGAGLIGQIAPGRFRYGSQEVSLEQLITGLRERAQESPLIVVARLFNHPGLADLADQSLITLRVFTCLDAHGDPVVAMAMLRILGKLEPAWHSEIEWGAAIDLDSGRLGLLVSDIPHQDNGRYTHHPLTHRRVSGRIVPFWPEVCRVAKAGHNVARDRVLIGWDIAVTPAGPVILEANGVPDFIFPQRVLRVPVGETRLGQLLAPHLDRLEREIALLPPELRK